MTEIPKDPTQPKFHDRELQSAFEKADTKMKHFRPLLDRTTNDIRGLEAFLEERTICIYAEFAVPTFPGLVIKWCKSGIGKGRGARKWRLCGEVDGVLRPLEEWDVRTRMIAGAHLSSLLEVLSRNIPDLPDIGESNE